MATANGILNGLKVESFDFAETPRSTPEDRRYYKEVLEVLLEDGSVVYNCVWPECEFTRSSASGVWPHTKVHKTQTEAPSKAPESAEIDVTGLTIAELIERAQHATRYRSERDAALKELSKVSRELEKLKPRAKKAEQALKTIRNAFTSAA
ncbi:hypothetical protein [Streptomyces mutabilis]|uniref:Uncharacterized protein n=1 Tax=Streptomyces mutabilis TaxID=67332 RepID=A0A086MRG5_9ACTN|nr:hypothetical protein [Streptomyces mutabilis]KFG71483.1 hypothetical protein FM21_35085 [Streptomyces mutabilis]